jgi:hypothetical protein
MRTLRPSGPVEFTAGIFRCRFAGARPVVGHAAILDMGRGWNIVFQPEDYDPVEDMYTCRSLLQRHQTHTEASSLGRARRA